MMNTIIKNETAQEKEYRIFKAYKKILSKDRKTRFNVVEHVCRFSQIDPYKMAASLINDGITVLFDDTSISVTENKRKKSIKISIIGRASETGGNSPAAFWVDISHLLKISTFRREIKNKRVRE